jgi:hypothetical protein
MESVPDWTIDCCTLGPSPSHFQEKQIQQGNVLGWTCTNSRLGQEIVGLGQIFIASKITAFLYCHA